MASEQAASRRIVKRRGCIALFVLTTALVVAIGLLKARWDTAYFQGYDPDLPLNAAVDAVEALPAFRRAEFSFDGVPGVRVPAVQALPAVGAGPFPCVIFLHGIGQDKGYLDELAPRFVESNFALASFDQHTRGARRLPQGTGSLQQALALRRRGALTVIETRRLVDYLQTRADIDHDGIYLVGASFGAITGCTAAAFEPRLRAAVLTYGGGDLSLLLPGEQVVDALGSWTPAAVALAVYFMAPIDPVRHAHRIAPRPVLFQNGTRDTLIPVEAAQALFDAARPPKEMVWYYSDHVGLDEAHVRRVVQDAIAWLEALHFAGR